MTTTTQQTFTSLEAAKAAGVTYRQLDYWLRTGAVKPTAEAQPGSGNPRRFAADEVQALIEVAAMYRAAKTIVKEMSEGVLWETARGKEPFRERT